MNFKKKKLSSLLFESQVLSFTQRALNNGFPDTADKLSFWLFT